MHHFFAGIALLVLNLSIGQARALSRGEDLVQQSLAASFDRIYDDPAAVQADLEPLMHDTSWAASHPDAFARGCVLTLHAAVQLEDSPMASDLLQHCLQVLQNHATSEDRVHFYIGWAAQETDARHFEKAAELLHTAETLTQPLQQPALRSFLLHQKASLAFAQGDDAAAIGLLKEAYQLSKGIDDVRVYSLKNRLARAYYVLGDQKRARELYFEVYAYASQPPKRFMLSFVSYNIALLLMDKEPDAAFRYYEESILHSHATGQRAGVAYGLQGQARVRAQQRNFAPILPWLEEALRIFRETKSRIMEAETLYDIALYHKETGHPEASIQALKKALPIFQENELDHDLAKVFKALAEQYAARGDLKEALAAQNQFIASREKDLARSYNENLARQRTSLDLEIEEQKNTHLKQENELQSMKIRRAEQERLILISFSLVSLIAILSLLANAARSREIKRAKLKLQTILDQIEEGIAIFGSDFMLERPYSPFLKKIFDCEAATLEKTSILDLLLPASSLDADQQNLVRSTLGSIFGDDPIAWELNHGHLPRELSFLTGNASKSLVLHWQPIFASGARATLTKIMLSIRDETETRTLERQIQDVRARHETLAQRIMETLSVSQDDLLVFLNDADRKMTSMETILHASTVDFRTLFHELHGIKGASRTLKLQQVSEAIHSMETLIQNRDQEPTVVESLRQSLTALRTLLYEYRSVLNRLPLGADGLHVAGKSLMRIADKYILQAHRTLQEHGVPMAGFTVEDQVLSWPPGVLERLNEALIHAINNSMDHGFLLPIGQGRSVAPAAFHILARKTDAGLEILFRDNGAGLNLVKLQDLAAQRGFVPDATQTLWDVVFLDGVSTSEKVTTSSGRGVGMAAIRSICESMGATVHLTPNPDGPGTLLRIILPQAAVPLREAV